MEYNRLITTAYDTADLKIQENKYNWNNESWEQTGNFNFGYDTLGNLIQRDWFILAFGNLFNNRRDFFTYDSVKNLINSKTILYNNNQWVNSSNYSQEFDSLGRITFSLNQTWDLNSNNWLNVNKTSVSYADVELKSNMEIGLKTTTETFQWIPAGEWKPLSESTTILNSNGLSAELTGKYYNINLDNWENFYQTLYSWHQNTGVVLLQQYSNKNTEAEEWNIGTKKHYYYNGINVFQTAKDINLQKILMFPNPVKDKLTIIQKLPRNGNIRIFNTKGEIIKYEPFNSAVFSLNVSDLKPGYYIVHLSAENLFHVQKIIKME